MVPSASLSQSKFWYRARLIAGLLTITTAFGFGLALRYSAHSPVLFVLLATALTVSLLFLIHADRRHDALNGHRYWPF
jgi:hypothetical protein